MALSKTVETKFGVIVDGCYLRVEQPILSKDTFSFILRSYVSIDKPSFDEETMVIAYNMLGENPYIQAYSYLKTLPEFADVVDI
jgi:hypothetical protein